MFFKNLYPIVPGGVWQLFLNQTKCLLHMVTQLIQVFIGQVRAIQDCGILCLLRVDAFDALKLYCLILLRKDHHKLIIYSHYLCLYKNLLSTISLGYYFHTYLLYIMYICYIIDI